MSRPTEPETPIRVWIVDDHAGFRRDLASVLERRGFSCEKVLSSCHGIFSDLTRETPPDVLLLDIRMPGISGIEALQEIRLRFPEVVVLMLTASDEERDLREALSKGAGGYLLKTATPSEIETAIRRARAGGMPIDPDMGAHLVPPSKQGVEDELEEPLTPRERSVLEQLAAGVPAKGIAAELGLSVHTVDTHIRNLYRKLAVPNQSAAVAKAFRLGILE